MMMENETSQSSPSSLATENDGKERKIPDDEEDHDEEEEADCKSRDPPSPTKLPLTPLEERIFRVILEACETFQLRGQVRAAGGWVRDKLLGLESDDLDLVLDQMMGEEFAAAINRYLRSQGVPTHDIGVIRSNPEQSKHLETAAFKIFGLSIDCTNTRTETYSETHRVPEIQLGTPSEDAYRRDFTFNALFYNLQTGEVEDFTRRGLQDLRDGVVRTPLPPLQTFKDDPLRVLRAVRFAGRFLFHPEEQLSIAAKHPDVQVR